jgi:ABC-type glycerol-3-phosphate transport system substrate-binding protein
VLAATLILTPLGARGADLVVWWEQGFYEQEDEAVREIVAAFEQETGKQVELTLSPAIEIQDKAQVRFQAGQPPDFLQSTNTLRVVPRWAYEDRLTDLEGALGPLLLKLFDPDAVEACTFLNGSTGRRGLYALPMGRGSNHVHVWNSLLEQAGFTLADIPRQWEAFWSFWCDQVQPALRRALGRDDIWGVGLPMSDALDTQDQLTQFQLAYDAYWFGPDRRLRVDDPEVRKGMVRALGDSPGSGASAAPATIDELGEHRQQQGVPGADRCHDSESVTVDPGGAQARAAERLLHERGEYRLAGRRQRPAARHRMVRFSAGSSSRPAGTLRSPTSLSASSLGRAGSPIGWISQVIATCPR